MSMDRKIEKKQNKFLKPGAMVLGALAVGYFLYSTFDASGGRTLRVENDRLVISTVTTGQFDDFIPVRGRVEPRSTIFLDAIEGGRVERIHVEDGAMLKAGDLIVELSNTGLQLDVLSNEARVTEQLNNMRTLELQLEQNMLGHRRSLVDINYQITRLTRLIERLEPLVEKGAARDAQLQDARDELTYYKNRREVTLVSQSTDERLQKAQVASMRASTEQLEANLRIAKTNLENLSVRAPLDGKLTAFDIEIGQSLNRGERIGQIDDPDRYKVTANIDEYYLNRVDILQQATFNIGGRDYTLEISKVYPNVTNGQFEVDMQFVGGEQPSDIRRGQTLNTRLQLGDPIPARLIPNGAFYQDTGGNWVFVVGSDGDTAVKRPVKLGRRNLSYIEVLEGLEPGERVITSPYTNYIDMERLELSGGSDD